VFCGHQQQPGARHSRKEREALTASQAGLQEGALKASLGPHCQAGLDAAQKKK